MRVLVIGQGGREHALVRALRLSPSVDNVYAVPGSDGMKEAICHPEIDFKTPQGLEKLDRLLRDEKIGLVIIGPEVPLADGLSDQLREKNHLVFGPSREAAKLESSKVYSKRFMQAAGLPTARSFEVKSVKETLSFAPHFKPPYVLKADGLAAGKGVVICADLTELEAAARGFFEEKILGSSGEVALLEEFSPGYEISFLVLTNGEDWEPLVLAADHKRLSDNDRGPNTGGMGTVAPITISNELREQIAREVFAPTMAELKKQKLLYRGVLYAGLMITPSGPSLIEFNVRFGDPETQVILPLLEGDWAQALLAIAEGRVPRLKWKSSAAACVVMAAPGYPEAPKKNVLIEGDLQAGDEASYFLHAGTQLKEGQWVTNGGRVLNAVGLGADLKTALANAYKQTARTNWPGCLLRKDIGLKVLREKRET